MNELVELTSAEQRLIGLIRQMTPQEQRLCLDTVEQVAQGTVSPAGIINYGKIEKIGNVGKAGVINVYSGAGNA